MKRNEPVAVTTMQTILIFHKRQFSFYTLHAMRRVIVKLFYDWRCDWMSPEPDFGYLRIQSPSIGSAPAAPCPMNEN